MSLLHIFKCRVVNINYVFKDGKTAVFKRRTNEAVGQYLTDDPVEVAELQAIAAKNHQHIYVDPNEETVDSELADPAVAYKKKVEDEMREKILADIAAQDKAKADAATLDANNGGKDPVSKDMGSTENKAPNLGISNSDTVSGAQDSNGPAAGGIKVNLGGGGK